MQSMVRVTFMYNMRFFPLLVLFILAFSAHKALAFDDREYTEPEKAGFAFYHFAGVEPDFNRWITEYEYYLKAKPSRKNEILQDDKIRLQKGMRLFNPEINYIEFKTDVRVVVPPEAKRQEFLNEYNKIPVKLELPRALEMPGSQETYFPFYVGKMWFAVIPQQYEEKAIIYMDENDYYNFTFDLDMGKQERSKVVNAEYAFRATNADTEQPFPIGDMDSWLIIAEIGSMKLFGKSNNKRVWEYEAPWYIPETKQNLLNLYQQ